MNSKRTFRILAGIFLVFTIFFFSTTNCSEEKNIKNEKIESIKKKIKTSSNESYDLSETIRIIHGLENAKKNSKNFEEYMEYMASQDYSKVAPDVLEAKLKLFPILEKLIKAEKELKNAQSLWPTFAKIGGVIVDESSQMATKSVISGGALNPLLALDIINSGIETIKIIEQQKDLENEVKNEISSIKDEYLDYLESYTKVYIKYMTEWDKVCLIRDNAYLELHENDLKAALISINKVLEINPQDKEARLLKAMCLIFMEEDKLNNELENSNKIKAKIILEDYIDEYPAESAPALVLLGSYHMINGNEEEALIYYNQSSVEYPKQAGLLLDMLNSYKQRSYLKKTAEGVYILELYKSMMEGFGLFSPNFHKALMAHNKGDFKKSKEEILKHFFRRSNQEVYDYLISDMNHCSNYLSESFNLIFKEKSFLDLEATTSFFNSNTLGIQVNNRSDVELNNVRLFLCIHFTDMYKDNYEVFKMPNTINKINPHSSADFGDIDLNFELNGKPKNAKDDIVHVRSIVLTDNIITWIDKDEFKITEIKKNKNYYADLKIDTNSINKMYETFGINIEELQTKIKEEIAINVEESYFGDNKVKIELPRILSYLNPIFSINELSDKEVVFPELSEINGKNINLEFYYDTKNKSKINFYINSSIGNFPIEIEIDQNNKLKDINYP